MSTQKEEKKKMKKNMDSRALTWQERKEVADEEGLALEKEVEELLTWTKMIEVMDDQRLKDYINDRPDHLKTVKTERSGQSKRVHRVRRSKSSNSSIIMSAVWKFHRQGSTKLNISRR